jgi:septal ring factor EnvC (AmiA/AmiB activator)
VNIEMSTIKELAETCGVSEQAIRKWCARNQVAKDVAQRYIIDKTTETAILQHYGKDTRNQVAQPTETSCETSETMKEIIEMLRKELEAKDKQIESLQHSLDRTTAALVSAQESIKAAQLLQANSEQKLKMIEKPAEEAERHHRGKRRQARTGLLCFSA